MALARLSWTKELLNISASTFDNHLKLLLEAATQMACDETNRALESATYTDELYKGDGSNILYLRQYPVTALSAVKIWDGTAYTTETSTYYELLDDPEDQRIRYPKPGTTGATYSAFPCNCQYPLNIKVTYTAGYVTTGWATATITDSFAVPKNLENAVARLAAIMFADGRKDQSRLGVASMTKSIETLVVERYANGLPFDIAMAFDKHKKVCF